MIPHLALLASIPLALLISNEVMSREFEKMPTCSSKKSVRKGLQGPSHLSLAWKNRSHWNSVMKNRMSFNVTGGDFPVEKSVRDRRNQQRLHIFYHVLAAQRRSNTSFFLAWRLVDILDEHYSFSGFFSKLCCALRGLRDLSERDRRWKQTFVAVRAFWSPKRCSKTSSHDA